MPEYSVPQFIEDEAKIIFFLTFRQFFIIVGGGVLCFVSYLILPTSIFFMAALLIIALVGIIAFVKIDGDSVVKIAMHFIGFSMGSKNYTWKKGSSESQNQSSAEMQNYEQPNFKPQTYVKKQDDNAVGKLHSAKKNIELKS